MTDDPAVWVASRKSQVASRNESLRNELYLLQYLNCLLCYATEIEREFNLVRGILPRLLTILAGHSRHHGDDAA